MIGREESRERPIVEVWMGVGGVGGVGEVVVCCGWWEVLSDSGLGVGVARLRPGETGYLQF